MQRLQLFFESQGSVQRGLLCRVQAAITPSDFLKDVQAEVGHNVTRLSGVEQPTLH